LLDRFALSLANCIQFLSSCLRLVLQLLELAS
jgi:hypothetical protein